MLAKVAFGTKWSYDISICFEDVGRPIAMGEDVGHGGVGGTFTAEEVLGKDWEVHFQASRGEWLKPIIQKMVKGEEVSLDAVLKNSKDRHGRDPYSFQAKKT